MTEEKSLSDKRKELYNGLKGITSDESLKLIFLEIEKQDSEAVRRLKEWLEVYDYKKCRGDLKLKEIFGEKLI